jgi:hypothetical protein
MNVFGCFWPSSVELLGQKSHGQQNLKYLLSCAAHKSLSTLSSPLGAWGNWGQIPWLGQEPAGSNEVKFMLSRGPAEGGGGVLGDHKGDQGWSWQQDPVLCSPEFQGSWHLLPPTPCHLILPGSKDGHGGKGCPQKEIGTKLHSNTPESGAVFCSPTSDDLIGKAITWQYFTRIWGVSLGKGGTQRRPQVPPSLLSLQWPDYTAPFVLSRRQEGHCPPNKSQRCLVRETKAMVHRSF